MEVKSKGKKSSAESFESAVGLFKAKNYDGAIDGFREYIENYPKGKKILDAHFLLGESLFKRKKYNEAIVELSVPQEKSPKSTMGRKSTLTMAESFKLMGKEKDAKAFAQILIDTSPNSDEAKAAKRFVK